MTTYIDEILPANSLISLKSTNRNLSLMEGVKKTGGILFYDPSIHIYVECRAEDFQRRKDDKKFAILIAFLWGFKFYRQID